MGFLHVSLTQLGTSGSKGGRPRKTSSQSLRNKVLWSAWALAEGGEDLLIKRHRLHRASQQNSFGLRADEVSHLRAGELGLSESRLQTLQKIHPSISTVMAWPFALLSLSRLTKKEVRQTMAPFLVKQKYISVYDFGADQSPPDAPATDHAIAYRDMERLYERGDPMGFFALVEVYRSSALGRDTDRQWIAAHYMIKALPGFCRHPAVRAHADAAIQQTKALLKLLPETCWPIAVDDGILHEQILSAEYIPSRIARIKRAKLGEFIAAPKDPFVHHRLIVCDEDESPALPSLGLP